MTGSSDAVQMMGAELVARGWKKAKTTDTWSSPEIRGHRYIAVAHSAADGGGVSISRTIGWRQVLAWYIPSAQVREDMLLDELHRAGVIASPRRMGAAS